jgi:hypothetical protein
VIETNSKNGFWQLPIALKFVVIWLGFLGSYFVLEFIIGVIVLITDIIEVSGDYGLNIGSPVYAIILFTLPNGLINKRISSRIWTSIFAGISFGGMAIILGLVILIDPLHASYWYKLFDNKIPVSQIQAIWLLGLFLILNASILYILLCPSAKAFFSRETPHPNPSPEPTPQEPA